MTMTWDWTDQAHLNAGQDEIEQAMRGNLAGAFEAEAVKDATARNQQPSRWQNAEPRPWHFAVVGLLAILVVLLVIIH